MLRQLTYPDWNGWIYYYNEGIRKLSYDEYGYKIDMTVEGLFLVGDHLQRVINKDWATKEVFDGLANAFDVLRPNAGVRETAANIKHHHWGSAEAN